MSEEKGTGASSGPVAVTEGPFAGWLTWSSGADPYETLIGPFCFRRDEGHVRCGFLPDRKNCNGGGFVHGGALMSFADFSLFAIAHRELEGVHAVTVTCNSEFLSAGEPGVLLEATGDVLRETRSLLFVRGLITQSSRPVLAFSGTLKKINRR